MGWPVQTTDLLRGRVRVKRSDENESVEIPYVGLAPAIL